MQGVSTNKTAAKNVSMILSAICQVGNTAAGESIGRDAAFISRLKGDEKSLTLSEFSILISTIGLEISSVAEDKVTIDRQLYDSLTYMAKLGLNHLHQRAESNASDEA